MQGADFLSVCKENCRRQAMRSASRVQVTRHDHLSTSRCATLTSNHAFLKIPASCKQCADCRAECENTFSPWQKTPPPTVWVIHYIRSPWMYARRLRLAKSFLEWECGIKVPAQKCITRVLTVYALRICAHVYNRPNEQEINNAEVRDKREEEKGEEDGE